MNIDELNILRKIKNNPDLNQRKLSNQLGLSLGKINYSIAELKKRGFIKIKNFKKSKNKINYFYILTPKGLLHKTKATINFMKIKIKEYEELKKELNEKDKL
jgi:EPS-associated MarR family transcriptional regulator